MSVMTEARLWPIEDRPLTVDDLARTPDDGNRYELVNGVLVVTQRPASPISGRHTLDHPPWHPCPR